MGRRLADGIDIVAHYMLTEVVMITSRSNFGLYTELKTFHVTGNNSSDCCHANDDHVSAPTTQLFIPFLTAFASLPHLTLRPPAGALVDS